MKELTVNDKIKAILKNGPRTPMEISIKLYGGEERAYRTPKMKDRPPKIICKGRGGEARVSHAL